MSFEDNRNTSEDYDMTEPETEKNTSRSRQNRQNATINLPGILVTTLFVLVEGWFFIRLLRFKMVPTKFMVLIALGLVLLAGVAGYCCWNFKRRTRFIAGAVIALLLSVGLIIGAGVIGKVHNSIIQWEETTAPEHQTVSMGIYVLKEDDLATVEDLSGSVIGIMETIDRDEAEQVLDEIGAKMKEPLQVRTYGSFAEAVKGLYDREVRAIILAKEYIDILEGVSGFENVSEKIRLITDMYAERPTQVATLPGESAASTAADSSESGGDAHHGTRSWSIIKHATTEPQESSGEETPTEAPTQVTVYTEGPIGTTPPPTEAPTAGPIQVPEGQEGRIFTIYISGLDTRGGGLAERGNSDVNILAVVNMNTRQVLLLNTPRDYFISFPTVGGARDKLTHAGYYSVQASMECLRNLYGVTSQYYFRVGFDGLKALVDAMGGVTVYSAYEFDTGEYKKLIETPEGSEDETAEPQYETAYKYHFTVGDNTVNGEEALAFARERRHLPGGDRDRGGNQLALIKAVIRKMASFSTIANLDEVLGAVGGLVRTTVPYDTIAAFGRSVLSGDSWNVVSYNVNGSGGLEYSFSIGVQAYVMYPNWQTVSYAQNLIRQVYNGEWVSP